MTFLIRLALLLLEARLQFGRKVADVSETAMYISEHTTCNTSSPAGDGDEVAPAGDGDEVSPADAEPGTQRPLFQIADVHGDYEQLKRLMKKLGLITVKEETEETAEGYPRKERWEWKGGNSIVVFTGDYVDRGLHSAWILIRLRDLKVEAATLGGEVVLLRGNHEQMLIDKTYTYMQLTDAKGYIDAAKYSLKKPEEVYKDAESWWYDQNCLVGPNYYQSLKKRPKQLFAALNNIFREKATMGVILRAMPAIKVVRELKDPIVFVHGGITYEHLRKLEGHKHKWWNDRSWLGLGTRFDLNTSGPETIALLLDKYVTTHTYKKSSDPSPLWDRTVAGADFENKKEENCTDVNETLTKLNVKRMVVGHSMQSEKAFGCRCSCTVILTDLAMSRQASQKCNKDSYEGLKYDSVSALYSDSQGDLFQLIEIDPARHSSDERLEASFTKKKITTQIAIDPETHAQL